MLRQAAVPRPPPARWGRISTVERRRGVAPCTDLRSTCQGPEAVLFQSGKWERRPRGTPGLNHPVDRRTFLKGVGVSLALPALESWGLASRPDAPVRRMVCVANPFGFSPDCYRPTTAGVDYETTEYFEALPAIPAGHDAVQQLRSQSGTRRAIAVWIPISAVCRPMRRGSSPRAMSRSIRRQPSSSAPGRALHPSTAMSKAMRSRASHDPTASAATAWRGPSFALPSCSTRCFAPAARRSGSPSATVCPGGPASSTSSASRPVR